MLEAGHVACLCEPLLGRQPENARDVVEHMTVRHGACNQSRIQLEPRSGEELTQRARGGIRMPTFDTGNHGLRRTSPAGDLPLRQTGASPRLAQQKCGIEVSRHAV